MTLKEFYDKVGGNYADVIKRLGNESVAERFALKFLNDTTFENLENNIKEKSAKSAFLAAHTLKGVCINLGFDDLYKVAYELTEMLRDKDDNYDFDECKVLFKDARHKYDIVTNAIKNLND